MIPNLGDDTTVAQRSVIQKSLRALAWSLVGFLLLIIALIVLLRFVNPPTSTFMLGHLFFGSSHELRHEWVSLDEISPWVPDRKSVV